MIEQFKLELNFDGPHGQELKDAFWYSCWRINEVAERLCEAQAKVLEKKGLLLDRCLAGHAAYLEGGITEFDAVTGFNFEEVLASYDLIIFLGGPSEAQYNELSANNPVRIESSFQENQQITKATHALFCTHPHFHFIPFAAEFDEKLIAARALITQALI